MRKKQSGVALVEFALVLPLLLTLSLIVTEYGRALFQYNTLAKSVRDATRYLSTQSPGTKNIEARKLVVYGKSDNTPLAVGLTLDKVKDPVWQLEGASPVINTVTVTISGCANSPPPCYKFTPLLASVFGLNFGTISFSDISATMRGAL